MATDGYRMAKELNGIELCFFYFLIVNQTDLKTFSLQSV